MKKVFLAFSFLLTLSIYGQNRVEFSLQQDARLFLVGDQKGNGALTTNLLSKLEIPVYSFEKSYLLAYISVEYADLVGKGFQRYAVGTGYAINSIYGKIGAIAYVDFGNVYRDKEDFFSYSVSGELNFKISERLKFTCTQQLTYRKDLKELYNTENPYIISGFVGLKYRF